MPVSKTVYLSLKMTEIALKYIFITRQTTYYWHKIVAKIMKINVGYIMTGTSYTFLAKWDNNMSFFLLLSKKQTFLCSVCFKCFSCREREYLVLRMVKLVMFVMKTYC